MYDELVKRVRQVAEEVCEDYDVDPYNAEQRFLVIEEAANAIEELSIFNASNTLNNDAMRWIPVTEWLPETYTWVLVSAENHKVAFDAFYDGDKWKDAVLNELIVTHWMPLPEPPKEVDDEWNE